MKSICKSNSIFFFILVISLISCSKPALRAKPGALTDVRTSGERNFNPLGYDGDADIVTADVPDAADSVLNSGAEAFPQKPVSIKDANQYFSVQVFASKSNAEAKEFKNTIEKSFNEEIRIDYQAPYYKVRIGKSLGYEKGEELLEKVNAMGFSKAWLVKIRK
jgi:hypothetical protein